MSSRKTDKKELGKGIRALLSNKEGNSKVLPTRKVTSSNIEEIAIDKIEVNPYQPRNEFEEDALQELANSIKIHGVIQPITVRKLNAHSFQIISGERRCRASKIAGKKSIPAYVRVADDQGMLEMALIENVQRENLNAVEIAISLQRLIDECDLTHDVLSERISKKRSTVTNYLRLLKLPPDIQTAIKNKVISMGHAKALLSIDDVAAQLIIFSQIVQNKLSVRAAEALAKKYSSSPRNPEPKNKSLPFEYKQIEDRLTKHLDARVNLAVKQKGKGTITIHFNSNTELNDIIDILEES